LYKATLCTDATETNSTTRKQEEILPLVVLSQCLK